MSNRWRVRPSEFYDIKDPVTAYQFDRAVLYFGAAYERDIEDVTVDAKSSGQAERAARVVTDRWLRDESPEQTDTPMESVQSAKKFRDPAEVFAEQRKLRADGQL